ncbi:MAG: zeta toxin family protein [Flavobacteriales bacterium]|nr:zeta toxin family protein [Flavobacteriales bacterium]
MPGMLRMRVFAGPNGSGKSTMYQQVRTTVVNDRPVDLGVYLNPDEITKKLKDGAEIDIRKEFGVVPDRARFVRFAVRSGLLRGPFDLQALRSAFRLRRSILQLLRQDLVDEISQLLTAYLCELLIKHRKKFSFETVFSHPSKLQLMEHARARGYKVYLYFIATNSAEINKDRVITRVLQGGHDVPADRIEKRYELALKQMLPALNTCYHGFVFDNSGAKPVVFAEVKQLEDARVWSWNLKAIPDWFIRSYLLPVGNIQLARRVLEERKAD